MELICTNSKHDSEMKPTSPKFSHTIQDPSRGPVFPFPTLEATKKKKNKNKNWSRNASRNCYWDRYWGRASQLLVNFFPVPGNSPRSLYES